MAKSSRKRLSRYRRDQSGCMWGLINIFDFRRGHPSQKLLSNKKVESRRVDGTAFPEAQLDTDEQSCDISNHVQADENNGTVSVDTSRLSVKELMDEEMLKLDQSRISGTEKQDKTHAVSAEQEVHGKKNRWRKSKMSFDLNDTTKSFCENQYHRKHKSLSSLDINNMVAELSSHHYREVEFSNSDQGSQESLCHLGEQCSSVVEIKVREAAMVLVSHFMERKNLGRDETMQPSRELLDALNVLNMNKEMFLKLLKDPDSQLVKHICNIQDIQGDRDEKASEQQDKQNNQHQSFFQRKFRGLERNSSKKVKHGQDVNRIIFLKPGLPEPHNTGNKGQPKKAFFSFFEFTRKLKHAMRKELPDAGKVEKAIGGESFGVAPPSREHFFLERIPKPSTNSKKGDKVMVRSNDNGSTPEQRISNIYVEAKKHLAEMVGDYGDVNANFRNRQVPKALGRILSYADYSSSPICSPRLHHDAKLLASVISPSRECQAGKEVASQQEQEELNSNVLTSSDNDLSAGSNEIAGNVEIPKSEVSNGVNTDDGGADKSSFSVGERILIQDVEGLTSTDLALKKNLSLDGVPGSCSPSIGYNEQVDGTLKDCGTKGQPLCLSLDFEEIDPLTSPLSPPSYCLKSKENEDQYAIADKSDEPSPVSVLDSVFHEDSVSPPSARSLLVTEQLIQPRKIKFEDQSFPSVPCSRISVEEKKSVFELVDVVMQASGLTWDELFEKSSLSNYLLEPSFFDELEFIPDNLFYDPQLLFDLIVEVLYEICRRDFDGIWLSVRPCIGSEFKGKDVTAVMCEGVAWHLHPEGLRYTLDQTVARDLAKSERWMDLRLDIENIGIGMEEAILDELVGEALVNCFCGNPEEAEFLAEPVES